MKGEQRILIVDNDPEFIAAATGCLAGDCQVIAASTFKDGMEQARNGAFDMAIVGYVEPRGASFKFHEELRKDEATRHIPMLVVDVRPEEHSRKGWNRHEGMHMEAEDYLSRPVNPAELRGAVHRILQRTGSRPMELGAVLEQMEHILHRIDGIEQRLAP